MTEGRARAWAFETCTDCADPATAEAEAKRKCFGPALVGGELVCGKAELIVITPIQDSEMTQVAAGERQEI